MYGYDSFVNYDEGVIANYYPNEEVYQGSIYSPEIDEIIDHSDEERADNSCYQYIWDEVVLPYQDGDTIMGEVG